MKKWKVLEAENCPDCGTCLEVLTDCLESEDTEFEVFFYDGDKVRCIDECGFESAMTVDEDGNSYLQNY